MSGIQQILAASSDPYRGFTGGSALDFVVDPNDASARVTLVNDGTVTRVSVGSMMSNWYTPTTAGVGASHWVRATVTSGSLSSGTTGSWVSINTNPAWVCSQTVIGTKTATVTLELATDSGGANIVGSCSVTITANVDA
jgi:hypothetical protein